MRGDPTCSCFAFIPSTCTTLELTNNGAVETHTFSMASAGAPWSVQGTGVTHTGNVDDSNIDVTVPTAATAIITRAYDYACEIGSTGYLTLDEAFGAIPAATPTTIKILKNIDHTGAVNLVNKNITIDLNSYIVNISTNVIAETALVVNGGSLSLSGNGELNVSGLSHGVNVVNNGSATVTSASVSSSSGGNAAAVGTGGDLLLLGDAIANGPYDCAVHASFNGSITVNGNAQSVWLAASADQNGSVYIKGNAVATAPGTDGAGAFSFSGGSITIDGTISSSRYIVVGSTVKGVSHVTEPTTKVGYYTYTDGTNTVWVKDDGSLVTKLQTPTGLTWDTSEAGKIIARWDAVPNAGSYYVYLYMSEFGTWSIQALTNTNSRNFAANIEGISGVYSFRVEALPVGGSSIYTKSDLSAKNGNYTYTAPVCAIGSVKYTTLDDALAAVPNSTATIIRLLDDVTHTSPILINNKDITFDISDYSLLIDTSSILNSKALLIENSGKVNYIGNNSFICKGYSYGVYIDGGEANLKSVIGLDSNVDSYGAYVGNGGILTLAESATGSACGAGAFGGSTITIAGDATATAAVPYTSNGARAHEGSIITIAGQACGNDRGIYVTGSGSKITVGSILLRTIPIPHARVAIQVESSGQAFVLGDCSLSDGGQTAVFVSSLGEVTIDGVINNNGAKYIVIYTSEFSGAPTERTQPTTKSGYHTYSTENGTVWVKDTVPSIPVVTPGAPLSFMATAGDSQVSLSWTAPADDGGAPIIRYEVSNDNGVTWTTANSNTGHTFTGLINGTGYTFKVRAVNSAGNGAEATTSAIPAEVNNGSNNGNGGNNGSGSNNNGNNGAGSSGNASAPTQTETTNVDNRPDVPTTTTLGLTVKQGNYHNAYVINRKMLWDVINMAMAEAGQSEHQKYAVSVILAGNESEKDSISIEIDQAAISLMLSSGVNSIEINTGFFSFSMDATTIRELLSRAQGDIIFDITPVYDLADELRAIIGERPVFNLTIKDSTGMVITDYGQTGIKCAIKYTPDSSEMTANLYAVKLIDGKPEWIDMSGYNNGRIIFFSKDEAIYGVGYRAPSVEIKDIVKHWAKSSIDFVLSRQLIKAVTKDSFAPKKLITKEEFIVALAKLAGVKADEYEKSSFSDIDIDSPDLSYIEWAINKGVVQGTSNIEFGSDKPISREQLALILYNFAKAINLTLPVTREAVSFADEAKISSKALAAVKALQQAGIMSSRMNGDFEPQLKVSRGELAAILQRLIMLIIDESSLRGWVQNDVGQWQYIDNYGKDVTGWLSTTDGSIYWFDDTSIMAMSKWVFIDDKWYYFCKDGRLATNTVIGFYKVGADGDSVIIGLSK